MSKKKFVRSTQPVRRPAPKPAPSARRQPVISAIPALPWGWLVGAAAAVLGYLLYVNTLGHQYALDDYSVMKDNWVVKGGLENLGTIFTTEYRHGAWNSPGSLYRPFTLLMFAVEWGISPDNPFLYHFINVALYAATGWVLWITWRRVLIDYPPVLAALATVIFMAHPVHTEVVANIKSRDEILSMLLCTGALYGVWRYFENNRTAWLVAAVAMYTVGQFSKEGSITFLAVLPLAIWFFGKRTAGQSLGLTAWFLAPALVFLLIRFFVLKAQPGEEDFSILDNFIAAEKNIPMRLASAFMMCGEYLWALVWPHPLVSDLGYPQRQSVSFADWRALTGFAAYAGMGVWALLNLKKKHFLSFAILYYLATFSLYSNVVYIIGTSYGERELYVPSLGFAFALAWFFVKIFKINDLSSVWNPNGKGVLVWGIAGALVIVYGYLTVQRNPAWYDSYELYKADLPHSPNCAKLNYHIGLEQAKRGFDEKADTLISTAMIDTAIGSYTKAISLYPKYHDAYQSRGTAHLRMMKAYRQGDSLWVNEYNQAEADFKKTLVHRKHDPKALSNLGMIYFMRSRLDSAEVVYRQAVQVDPRFVDARRNLGAVLAMKKQFPAAIEQWKEALKYDKDNVTLIYYIGSAYHDMNRKDEARPWLERAYALNPNLPRKQ